MLCNIYLCFTKEILEIEILKPKSLFSLLGLGHWGAVALLHTKFSTKINQFT